jgi:hypothetical protein
MAGPVGLFPMQPGTSESLTGIFEESVTVGTPGWFTATLEPEKGRVRLEINHATYLTAVVTRKHPSGKIVTVRAANGVALSGGIWLGYDYELPIGRPISYTAVVTKAGPVTDSFTAPDVLWETQDAWLKDPAVPARNMVVHVSDPGDENYDSTTGVFYVPGRPTPVTIGEVRRAATGTLTLTTLDAEEEGRLHLLTSSGHVLLFQSSPEYGVGSLYMALQTVVASRYSALGTQPERTWPLAYVEVDSPAGDVVLSETTWQAVKDTYATWADVLANEASWEQVLEGTNLGLELPPTLSWRGA